MSVERGEYRGEPFLTITSDEKGAFPTKISFGRRKAQLILDNLREIRKFAADGPSERRA